MVIKKEEIKIKIRDDVWTDKRTIEEIFDENVYQIHADKIPDDATIVDIGAYIGVIPLYLAFLKKNRKFRVYCYEPAPENFAILKENITLNNLDDRVFLSNKAISSVSGEKRNLYLGIVGDKKNYSGNTFFGDEGKKVVVETITIEDIFRENNIDHCNILKVDVEGAEFEALMAVPNSTLEKIDFITLEWHSVAIDRLGEQVFIDLINKLSPFFKLRIVGIPRWGGNIYGYKNRDDMPG